MKALLKKLIDKTFLAEVIQSGQSEPGEPAPQTFSGELQGTILTDGGTFNGTNLFGHGSWNQTNHPAENFSIGPLVNPACGGPNGSSDIGTIVINPNLPENTTATDFDLKLDILDNSAGLGAMFLFCVDTLEIFGTSTSGAALTSWDISGAPCPPEDIRVGMTAFGATSSYPVTNCDEINPVVETIVVVAPSICLPAKQCFELLFNCSLEAMIDFPDFVTPDQLDDLGQVPDDWQCVSEPGLVGYLVLGEDGEVLAQCGNYIFEKTGTGQYDLTAPPGADFSDVSVVESATTRDSIEAHLDGIASGIIHVSEGDNGPTANIPRDRIVKVKSYGKISRVKCTPSETGDVKACFRHRAFDYENGPGFWGSGAFNADVNGTAATTTPWNFGAVGSTVKSSAYAGLINDLPTLAPGWTMTPVVDPTMNSNDLVEWEYRYCGPAEGAQLEIINRSSGANETLTLNAVALVGSWTAPGFVNPANPTGLISTGRQPVAC